jgi:hypothetical protein
MAAVTSTLVALGGIGVSAAQAIKSQSQMKQATQASALAKQQLKQIKETNPFKALQVPTLGLEMAQQQQSQREAQMVGALQGVGAEGIIGGIGNVAAAGNEQDMALAAQANQAQYGRDMAQAEAQLGIGARQAERDFTFGVGEIQQQNAIRAQAQKDRNAAITGALGFAGSAASSLDDMIGLYRKQNANAATPKTGAGGGVNWDYLYGNKANIPGLQQPTNIVTGSNINDPYAVLGNQGNQVLLP